MDGIDELSELLKLERLTETQRQRKVVLAARLQYIVDLQELVRRKVEEEGRFIWWPNTKTEYLHNCQMLGVEPELLEETIKVPLTNLDEPWKPLISEWPTPNSRYKRDGMEGKLFKEGK